MARQQEKVFLGHPANPDFWRHSPAVRGACWVCGDETRWICLDLGFQHPSCDAYPDGNEHVMIIRGGRPKRIATWKLGRRQEIREADD